MKKNRIKNIVNKLPNRSFKTAIMAQKNGELDKAYDIYCDILHKDPNAAFSWINLGILNRNMNRYETAVIYLRRGLLIQPDNADAWSSLGNSLLVLNRLDEAKNAQEQALSIDNANPRIHYNYGLILRNLSMLDDAIAALIKAEDLGYDINKIRWDRSLTYLLKGDYKHGFNEYEARKYLNEIKYNYQNIIDWDGGDLTGKTLLLYCEQGQGDSLQFCRYIPQLLNKAEKIIFAVQKSLVDLFKNSFNHKNLIIIDKNDRLIDDSRVSGCDFKLALLSLPLMLSITNDLFSTALPYITVKGMSNLPRIKAAANKVFRIAIVWAGSPSHKNDRNRSINLLDLESVFNLPNIDMSTVKFISFQMDKPQEQIKKYGFNAMLRDISPYINNFADSASLLQDIDLVISVDTSIVHLAGAMAIPTWVLLPFTPDWRWQAKRNDSPWYNDNMKLYRQLKPSDWRDVILQISQDLQQKLMLLK